MQGLITEDRADIDPDARSFARRKSELGHQGLSEGASLVEVVLSNLVHYAVIRMITGN
jgi:malate dehydrogenase (decarboxylating)